MRPEDFVKAQIAQFVHVEAAHCGGFDQMLAVACVLRNRVKQGWNGGDWQQTLNAAPDFASLSPAPRNPINLSDPAFRRVLSEVDDIFLGTFADSYTGGGLYYMDFMHSQHGQQVRPWFAEKILSDQVNHRRIAQVGMLYIFA